MTNCRTRFVYNLYNHLLCFYFENRIIHSVKQMTFPDWEVHYQYGTVQFLSLVGYKNICNHSLIKLMILHFNFDQYFLADLELQSTRYFIVSQF